MRFFYLFTVVLLSALLFDSCKKMPDGGIPFYMKMDSVTVALTDPAHQGSYMTYNISDVWVEANTDNLGAYQIPCNYPVLQENAVRFVASAGVWESGQSATRDIYPFYDVDTFTINATPGLQYSHTLHFKYKTAAQFSFVDEEYEFNTPNGNFSNMALCNDTNVRYGLKCGKIAVFPPDSNILALQTSSYTFPVGQEIWLELDYKCDIPFWVGFNGYFNNSPEVYPTNILFVNPKPQWTKIYVKLSDAVASVYADTYRIYFEALKPANSAGGTVYLDNIKLVHF